MFRSIVVGTDGSEMAAQAVREAVDLARQAGASVTLVSTYASGAREAAHAALRDARQAGEGGGVTIESFARQGDPADALLDVAEERGADLVVVGSKGITGAERFLLGSVPIKVAHHAPCSVLIVRTT